MKGKGFEWKKGMRDLTGNIYLGQRTSAPADIHQWLSPDGEVLEGFENQFYLPDLSDPATLGCFLALVREAHDNPRASVYYVEDRWRVSLHDRLVRFPHNDVHEESALVAALEATPEVKKQKFLCRCGSQVSVTLPVKVPKGFCVEECPACAPSDKL